MEDSSTINLEPFNQLDARLDPLNVSSNGSDLFPRRIKFHPARKPFKCFDNGDADFKLETLNPISSSDSRKADSGPGQSGHCAKKTDRPDFLESGLDPELRFEIKFGKIGAGLENLGNTCFLNSVLQCLTYTEPLAAYLQSGKHKSSCHVAGFCALCAIQNHVSRALQSTGRILVPKDLVSNLRCISRNFRNARQEDAHEYMVNLLESMHRCCLPSGVPSESPGAYEKSLVHKIFGGRLRSQVKCQQCSYCSNKCDPFLDLSLEIVQANSLYKALEHFTAKELLDGGERHYQCQRCKQKVKATKQLTVDKPPFVLTIHLKRFHSHDPGCKIKKKVQFDSTLDLKHFVSGSYEGDLKYSLYGVLVHSGYSTHSGHYFCYVRTSNGMWYTLDDNRVSHVSEQVVLDQQAYMLFYVRDRSNVIPQKTAVAVHKEKVNASGSMISTFNSDAKVSVQTDRRENGVVGAACFSAEIKKDTSICCASRVSLSMDAYSLQNNDLKPVEKLNQKRESVPKISSLIEQVKDPSNVHSVPNLITAGMLPSSDQPADNRIHYNILKTFNGSMVFNSIYSNGSSILKDDTGSSASKTVICSEPRVSSIVDGTLEKVEGSVDVSVCEKAGGDGTVPPAKCVKIPRSKEIASVDLKPVRKLKRQHVKHIKTMPLRSNVFYMLSLGMQKRKKQHKRSKRHGIKKQLLASDLLSGLGPSTSDEAGRVSFTQLHSQRNGSKSSCHKNGVCKESLSNSKCSDLMDATVVKEFKNRIEENSAGNKLPSVAKPVEGRISNCPLNGNGDANTTHAPSVRTHCLEETVVARWDGVELPSSDSLWSNGDTVPTTIGYVGDEWDEEYDRGRRKKVKLFEQSFSGLNPFQEIANQKSQFKKPKVDKCAGNQPFRI